MLDGVNVTALALIVGVAIDLGRDNLASWWALVLSRGHPADAVADPAQLGLVRGRRGGRRNNRGLAGS